MKKVAVILNGCGHRDGSEIHEAVLALLAIEEAGATWECLALDKNQAGVVDHITGDVLHEENSGKSAVAGRNMLHESARIDRQLFGRGGRQGDPGSFIAIVALDDEIFSRFVPPAWLATARGGELPARLGRWLRRWAQSAAERLNAGTRRNTLTNDERTERMLAFSGRGE